MEYYIFKVEVKGKDEIRTYGKIACDSIEFINYNTYLERYYFTDIEGNEDYIPYKNNDEVIIILNEDQFEKNDLENVFEILLIAYIWMFKIYY